MTADDQWTTLAHAAGPGAEGRGGETGMTLPCPACDGERQSALFMCGPRDPEAPLTGEMSCDITVTPCRLCSGTGRVTGMRLASWRSAQAAEERRLGQINAIARARHAWTLGKRP